MNGGGMTGVEEQTAIAPEPAPEIGEDAGDATVSGPLRYAFLALGWLAVLLGFIGAFLPVLPTTPFLLVAAWAFARSSRRMRLWLYGHPRFGAFLRDWRDEGAIPLRGKVAALGGMLIAWHVVFLTSDRAWTPIVVGACLAAVAVYVASRPTPRRQAAGGRTARGQTTLERPRDVQAGVEKTVDAQANG